MHISALRTNSYACPPQRRGTQVQKREEKLLPLGSCSLRMSQIISFKSIVLHNQNSTAQRECHKLVIVVKKKHASGLGGDLKMTIYSQVQRYPVLLECKSCKALHIGAAGDRRLLKRWLGRRIKPRSKSIWLQLSFNIVSHFSGVCKY